MIIMMMAYTTSILRLKYNNEIFAQMYGEKNLA